MSESETQPEVPAELVYEGEIFDDPNRQAVGLPPAWEEGTGGEAGELPQLETESEALNDLDAMTKTELLDEAEDRGVDVQETMTKAEIRGAIEAS